MSGDHHAHPPSELEARTLALESLLVEKGLLTSAEVDEVVRRFAQDIGPMSGARMVARAWVDPEFREALLADAHGAVEKFGGIDTPLAELRVVADEPGVHNMIVCTLCSCYPWMVLGLPPTWYKSAPYRSRVVLEPRVVLREMGLELPADVQVRVWDSSADIRYMVLPERPDGTQGWSEEQLASIVTRDCMIGVARPAVP